MKLVTKNLIITILCWSVGVTGFTQAYAGCQVATDIYQPVGELVLHQRLRNKTVRENDLLKRKDDQESLLSLYSGKFEPQYKRSGLYKGCNISDLKFADERFPSSASALAGRVALTSVAGLADTIIIVGVISLVWVIAFALAGSNGSGSGRTNRNQRDRDNYRHRHHWDHYNPYDQNYYRTPRRHRRDYFASNIQLNMEPYALTQAVNAKPLDNHTKPLEEIIPEEHCNLQDFVQRYVRYTAISCK